MQTLRQALAGKRLGLVLSAGYFGFYGHAGFVDALLGEGLQPAAWAGTSAGGLIAGFGAAGLDPKAIIELVRAQQRSSFWDPDVVGITVGALRRGSRPSGLLTGARFRQLLERHLPVSRFDALPAPLAIVATNLSTQRAITITSGNLASAIHASCAYPGLFQAVERDGHLLWDGGIVDKAPAVALLDAQVAHLDAVLIHYLPSQGGSKAPGGPFAYASAMSSGFAAVRREHFRLQLEVLERRGVPAFVVTSRLPPVSPRSMQASGSAAIDAGHASLLAALDRPPRRWDGDD